MHKSPISIDKILSSFVPMASRKEEMGHVFLFHGTLQSQNLDLQKASHGFQFPRVGTICASTSRKMTREVHFTSIEERYEHGVNFSKAIERLSGGKIALVAYSFLNAEIFWFYSTLRRMSSLIQLLVNFYFHHILKSPLMAKQLHCLH
jgi:hypothetical protein